MATEQRSPDDTTRYRAAAQRTAITRLYDASGRELAHFEGEFISFSQDGQSLLAYADGDYSITQLYDLAGNKLASLNGGFRKLSQDGRWII
ncbi:hypothetical protein N836_01485 [Leptolyngbya sp. Heron Island J]|uniref:hypothetical protein n=1 Tax=Leptolyngbya sp. Heron Island J TaxID=1385935 RepID=UPI0003B971FA|nr:hypothetical protein [Leptolyngbya sp. Heron Island J]ESA33468.1 hypothetical protein N836_01485 [Leptolyngbya sp. Heron Island J]